MKRDKQCRKLSPRRDVAGINQTAIDEPAAARQDGDILLSQAKSLGEHDVCHLSREPAG